MHGREVMKECDCKAVSALSICDDRREIFSHTLTPSIWN